MIVDTFMHLSNARGTSIGAGDRMIDHGPFSGRWGSRVGYKCTLQACAAAAMSIEFVKHTAVVSLQLELLTDSFTCTIYEYLTFSV